MARTARGGVPLPPAHSPATPGPCRRRGAWHDSGSLRSIAHSTCRRCRTSEAHAAGYSGGDPRWCAMPCTARLQPARRGHRSGQAEAHAVAGNSVALAARALHQDLHPVERGVHGAGGAGTGLLAEHEPRLECLAELERHSSPLDRAQHGEAKLEVGSKPLLHRMGSRHRAGRRRRSRYPPRESAAA